MARGRQRFDLPRFVEVLACEHGIRSCELENALGRALVLAGTEPIAPSHLPSMLAPGGEHNPVSILDALLVPRFSLDALERDLIHHALIKAGGNKAAAARLLGITRRRLYSRLDSLGESPGDDE